MENPNTVHRWTAVMLPTTGPLKTKGLCQRGRLQLDGLPNSPTPDRRQSIRCHLETHPEHFEIPTQTSSTEPEPQPRAPWTLASARTTILLYSSLKISHYFDHFIFLQHLFLSLSSRSLWDSNPNRSDLEDRFRALMKVSERHCKFEPFFFFLSFETLIFLSVTTICIQGEN